MQTHAGDAVSNLLTHAESIAVAMLHAFGMWLSVTDTTGICPPTSGAVCLCGKKFFCQSHKDKVRESTIVGELMVLRLYPR